MSIIVLMTLTKLNYLDDDNGEHDQKRDDEHKWSDDFEDTNPNIKDLALSCNEVSFEKLLLGDRTPYTVKKAYACLKYL